MTTALSPLLAFASEVPASTISLEDGKHVAKPISAQHTDSIKASIRGGPLSLHTNPSNLSFADAKSSTNSKGETLVMIPIINEGIEYSNISVVFSNQGDIAGYNESHFVEKPSTSGHVTSWSNGKKIQDKDVSAPQGGITSPRSVGDAISELNRCLSAAGIPAWIVAAATAVRSYGSLPGYIACLTAAGVGGGTAGYCGASAWDKL
ncbi:hypothetical protein [Corynebacterium heidelbergense]|uniref:hypothetical protein n=1 Tax=Corynebacterium heidelbergense TaxID=2055947 RepID=UPI0011BE6347|nr:hypothetical protein [Corynebacterium heidelbergense]